MTQKLSYVLLFIFILFACSSLALNIWQYSQREAPILPKSNTIMQTGEEKIFFNSLLGSSEAEITAINGDQVTFKNSKGESLTLRLTANSLIVFPDGTSNSRIDGLHVGSNVLLTARMTDGQNEITSININDGVGVTNQNTKSQNVSPIPYASSLP